MREGLDHRVHDAVALDEIDLYAEVLSAVAAVDRPLTAAEIDAVLGLDQVHEVPSGRAGQPSSGAGSGGQAV